MASRDTSLRDHNISREDLALIAKSLKDEKFRALFNEYAKEVSEPENKKHYEKEVKQLEKERGVEAVFVHPSPGFALSLGSQGSDAYVYVNICSSDVVQRPSFVRVNEGGKQGQNWSLPHALPKPRHELLGEEGVKVPGAGEEGQAREGVKMPGGEGQAGLGVKKALVYDVVFHPDALQLANRRPVMKRTLINSAMESLSKTYTVKSGPWQEVENHNYVGVPVQSVIKRVVDKKLFEKSECMSFQPLDERTWGKQKKNNDKTNCDGNENMSNKAISKLDEPVAPAYVIKHVSKMDLQDYTVQMIPQYKQPWRPQALEIGIELPGVTRASQVDANVWQQTIFLLTESTPKYKLELPLPYPVNEDTSAAKFDVSTQKLTLTLTVIPADKKHPTNTEDHSPSSDSGIECDYRTNSDVDNSSEASVSSQEEETAQRETTTAGDEEEDSVFEPEPPHTKVYLLPSYTVKHNKKNLIIILNCGNVLPSSVKTKQPDSETASIELSSIGGGQTLLHYWLKIDCRPHHIAMSGVSFKLEEKQVVVTVKKGVSGQWRSCQLGHEDSMVTVALAPLTSLEGEEEKSKPIVLKSKEEEGKKSEGGTSTMGVTRPHRMSRTVSMCETGSAPQTTSTFRLRGPTCSWPRGILKHRSRSLSESQICTDFSALSLLPTSSSLDMDSKLDGEDEGEESVEESTVSSFGEKKSVRFNEVVSKQLFRSNSSILGQRAKNQKKAMKKRKGQAQQSAGSGQDSGWDLASDGLTTSTDEDTDATTTTDATEAEDLDEVSLTADDVENNNLNNTSNMSVMNQNYHESINGSNSDDKCDNMNEEDYDSGFILKINKKKKRNKKNKANFEPSNSLIFQLDIDK